MLFHDGPPYHADIKKCNFFAQICAWQKGRSWITDTHMLYSAIDVQFKDIVHPNALRVPIAYIQRRLDCYWTLPPCLLFVTYSSIGCVCATHMLCFYTGFSKILMNKTTIPCRCKMLLPVTKIYLFIFLAKWLREHKLTHMTQFSRLPWIVLPLCFF